MDVYYPGIAAGDAATIGTDGTVSAIVTPNATYQVYELDDKTFSTPLTIKTPSGLTDTKVPVGNLPIFPDVYVVSPNYSHNWKSGDLVFRRDSDDAKDKAVATAVAAAQAAVAAVPMKVQEAVASGNFRGPAGKDGANGLPGPGAVPADQAVAGFFAPDVTSQSKAAADGRYTRPENLDALRQKLDIWPAFNIAGGADSWDATDYDKFMVGVTAMMKPAVDDGRATRTQYGTGYNAIPLIRYTAGPVDAPHVFLGGGMHGIELLAQHAALRFFQAYVYSDHPAMKALRTKVRITWVPSSNPTSYRTRRSSLSGVDVNRNFPFNWDYYDNADPDRYKGPTAASEPEAQAMMSLFAEMNFALMFDCHCVGDSDPIKVQVAPGGTWLSTNRALPHAVLHKWAAIYNADKSLTYGELGDGNGGDPTFKMWAAKYIRYDRKNVNGLAMTMEASDRLHGSTLTVSTRKGLQAYCGYIALLLADWLESGHVPPTPVARTQWAENHNAVNATVAGDKGAAGTALADGGKWVKTNTLQPLVWRGWGNKGAAPEQNFMDFPMPHTGTLIVEASGQLMSQSVVDYGGDVPAAGCELYLAIAPSPAAGGQLSPTVSLNSQRRLIVPGATAALGLVGVDFYTRLAVRVPSLGATNVYRAQLYLRKITPGVPSFIVAKADLTFTASPDTTIDPAPLVNRKA